MVVIITTTIHQIRFVLTAKTFRIRQKMLMRKLTSAASKDAGSWNNWAHPMRAGKYGDMDLARWKFAATIKICPANWELSGRKMSVMRSLTIASFVIKTSYLISYAIRKSQAF